MNIFLLIIITIICISWYFHVKYINENYVEYFRNEALIHNRNAAYYFNENIKLKNRLSALENVARADRLIRVKHLKSKEDKPINIKIKNKSKK